MNNQEEYIQFGLGTLNYKSKQDLYENLYLKAIVDSYTRISHVLDKENNIRDRFVLDMEHDNENTKELIQSGILQLDFERMHFVSEDEKRRTDLVFFISGFGNFTIECKRLFEQNSKNDEYISNGLSRFIDLKYSQNNFFAGMMGFVVSGNEEIVTNKLKEKVVSTNNIDSSFANGIFESWKLSFNSSHNRIDNTQINIYHLFFSFKDSPSDI